jgi:hypothetical protein
MATVAVTVATTATENPLPGKFKQSLNFTNAEVAARGCPADRLRKKGFSGGVAAATRIANRLTRMLRASPITVNKRVDR